MKVLFALLLLCSSACAQQGSGVKALLAPPILKTNTVLTWESNAKQFNVYRGQTKQSQTLLATINTNRLVITNGIYKIAVKDDERIFIYWPSNAIYVPVLYYSTNMIHWTRDREYPEVTNTPIKFLRMVNEFKGWK